MEPDSNTVTMAGHSRQRSVCTTGMDSEIPVQVRGFGERGSVCGKRFGAPGGCRETHRACQGCALPAGFLQMCTHSTASLLPWMSLLREPTGIIRETKLYHWLPLWPMLRFCLIFELSS